MATAARRRRQRLGGMVLLATIAASVAGGATYRIAETLDLDQVPSWFPVGFCLLTHSNRQYAAYYNAKHEMIVAERGLDDRSWQKVTLPSKVGWDSHNYITMAVDSRGDLHVAGNMHCVPLIYFRTRTPGDITSFERLPMTGQDEKRCTYPRFLKDADGNLVFMYRSGGSGNGRRFFNAYDTTSLKWSRFIDGPLFEGQGKRNAYPHGPTKGPDGRFHVVWVWRDTPDCATNHHLSYARSRDLKNWETAAGAPLPLPFLLEHSGTWVDAVPAGGGIINGCERLTFDSRNRPIVSYHKSDAKGHMQVYVARFEGGKWRSHPVTEWDKRIAFSGYGAMPFIGIRVSGLQRIEPDKFLIGYRHRDYGSGRVVLDEKTLMPTGGEVTVPREYPPELQRATIDFDGIRVKTARDPGEQPDADMKYLLRWETLGAHHDRPRKPPLPPASTLQLVRLVRTEKR
jgi:hypothetical protein